MGDLNVYRSTHPDVLATWHATLAAIEAWRPKVETLMEELGVGGRKILYDRISGQVHGVSRDGDTIPAHWRYDQRKHCLVPRRSTKQGKAIGAHLDTMRRPDPRNLKGMPATTFAADEPALLTCGLEEMDGALYVIWSAPIREAEIDPEVWERIKLSEYYGVVEAHEAAKAVSTDG